MSASPPAAEPAQKRRRSHPDADAADADADDAPPLRTSAALTSAAPASLRPPARPRVLIWDLDETLIIFNSLLDRSFTPVSCAATNRRALKGLLPPLLELREMAAERERLARGWETLVLSVCDSHFFFRELEACEATTLTDLSADDDGARLESYDWSEDAIGRLASHRFATSRCAAAAGAPGADEAALALSPAERRRLTAYRLRVAGERYAQGSPLRGAEAATWHRLYADTDAFSQSWLQAGRQAVAQAAEAGFENVLVTAGCLLPTLAKLVLFKLDGLFKAPHAVLSARGEGKAACFARIAARFGPDARFVVIGDGCEEAAAARALRWPLVPVAPVMEDGAMPPHAITVELLRRHCGDDE